jgi:hypothetical protein
MTLYTPEDIVPQRDGPVADAVETIAEEYAGKHMSKAAQVLESTFSYVVIHTLLCAASFVTFCAASWSAWVRWRQLDREFATGKLEAVRMMAFDLVFLIVVGGLCALEVVNVMLASEAMKEPLVYVPLKVRKDDKGPNFLTLEYVPDKPALERLNAAFKGLPAATRREIDVGGYLELQNIQNYSRRSWPAFTNSCSFGLDLILGKMVSSVEQRVDAEFVKNFRAVVATAERTKALFLKHCRDEGVSQAVLEGLAGNKTAEKLLELPDIKGALPVTSTTTSDVDQVATLLKELGDQVVADMGNVERETQLLTLMAAPTVARGAPGAANTRADKYKQQQIVTAFHGSDKRVVDIVATAMASEDRVTATFRNMSAGKMKQLSLEIALVREMVDALKRTTKDRSVYKRLREYTLRVPLSMLAVLAFVCLLPRHSGDRGEVVDCHSTLAARVGRDVTGMSASEAREVMAPLLRDAGNYKLRSEYARCLSKQTIASTDHVVTQAVQYAMRIVLLLIVLASINGYFADEGRSVVAINDNLEELSKNLESLANGIGSDGVLDIRSVANFEEVVKRIRTYKNRIPMFAEEGVAVRSISISAAARYTIISCVALAAVFILIKKMAPQAHVQRLRSLNVISREVAKQAAPARQAGGAGGAPVDLEALKQELDILKGAGPGKEAHLVLMVFLLATASYAAFNMLNEVAATF